MKPNRKYLSALAYCLAVLTSACFGGNGQREASALIERATELSDIRGSNAPAFHLKAKLTFYQENSNIEGTYSESWVSGGQWRRETIVGSFYHTEVASGDKRWVLDNTNDLQINLSQPQLTLAVWRMEYALWKSGRIEEKTFHGQGVHCLMRDAYSVETKAALCFDKVTGALAVKVDPVERRQRIVDQTCEYGGYQSFGEKTFPRIVRCFDGSKLKLEVRVLELDTANNLSAELFAPLGGAKESFNCQGILETPKPVSTPNAFPPRAENPKHPVVLLVMVGKNGRTQDIRITKSIDKDFDSAAVNAVRRWKFEPAKCEGEPIELEINVEIQFHIQP
jgi:protein TonB